MKKILYILITIIFSFTIYGCNLNLPSHKKPYNFYYTNLLAKNLTLESKYECRILDTNFYKEQYLTKEEDTTIFNFVKI